MRFLHFWTTEAYNTIRICENFHIIRHIARNPKHISLYVIWNFKGVSIFQVSIMSTGNLADSKIKDKEWKPELSCSLLQWWESLWNIQTSMTNYDNIQKAWRAATSISKTPTAESRNVWLICFQPSWLHMSSATSFVFMFCIISWKQKTIQI